MNQSPLISSSFGFSGSFRLDRSVYRGGNSYLKPYVGAKMGAMFARNSTYFGVGGLQDKKWGFYVSPEVGLKIHPTAGSWGLHVAGYYSYATNQTHTLTCQIDGQSNIGFRLGVIF